MPVLIDVSGLGTKNEEASSEAYLSGRRMAMNRHSQAGPFLPSDSLVLESMGVALMVVDRQRRVVRFNPLAEQLTGVSRDIILGHRCYRVLQATSCHESCPLRESLKSGTANCCGTVFLSSSGKPALTLAMTASAIRENGSHVIGAVAILRNVLEEPGHMRIYSNRILVSQTPKMRRIFDALPQLASSKAPLLIVGERGAGRSMLAETIHQLGATETTRPLVSLSCSKMNGMSLAETLGSFDLEAAEESTLLVEDVCRAPPHVQRELLAWVDNGGGQGNVRLISTATRQLWQKLEERRFREDLFYRLNVLHVAMPSLRERREDIPLLVEQFIDAFNLERGLQVEGLSVGAMHWLLDADLPGNVRQLRRLIDVAHARCNARIIDVDHLPTWVGAPRRSRESSTPWPARKAHVEKEAIVRALRQTGGNIAQAAKELRMHRSTLWRKAKRYGITI